MEMTFATVATAAACAALLLSVGFLFASRFMLAQWGLDATTAGLVLGRRIGAIYLGMSLLLFLGRSAPPSDLRSAVCAGLGLAIALLAVLGVIEFASNRVRAGIAIAVIVEVALAAGFFWVL